MLCTRTSLYILSHLIPSHLIYFISIISLIPFISLLQNPDLPPAIEGDDWRPKVHAMNSAYKEAKGVEPEFTNWSKVKEDVRICFVF